MTRLHALFIGGVFSLFSFSTLKVTLGELGIARRLKREECGRGVLSISLRRELPPPFARPGPPAPTSGALMHAPQTARVSAPRPEQTGHLFTRRSKSLGLPTRHPPPYPPLPAPPPSSSSLPVDVSIFQPPRVSMRNKRPAPLQQVKPWGTRRAAARGEIKGRRKGGTRDEG